MRKLKGGNEFFFASILVLYSPSFVVGAETVTPLKLDPEQLQQAGVTLATATGGTLSSTVSFPGKVELNSDHLAHVVLRVPGVVREIRKTLGDVVKAGEVLAVIDSRELADDKSAYLAARERVGLAQATFAREGMLWKEKISAQRRYLEAKQALAEARIALRTAEQKLLALSFKANQLEALKTAPTSSLTRYEVLAPFTGTIIQRDISLGEALADNATVFVIADLSTVWVDLNIASKELPAIAVGQKVVITSSEGSLKTMGKISYIQPTVSEETRTTSARVVLKNTNGKWRPGLFVTASVVTAENEAAVAVPPSALQTVNDKTVVFVRTPEGFVPRSVGTGRRNESEVEITAGLKPGEQYAVTGGFILKSQLQNKAE